MDFVDGYREQMLLFLTLSVPSQFSPGEKKGNFIAALDFMLEGEILSIFLLSQVIELFHRTMKKIETPAKYELFLPKPLTLTLF